MSNLDLQQLLSMGNLIEAAEPNTVCGHEFPANYEFTMRERTAWLKHATDNDYNAVEKQFAEYNKTINAFKNKNERGVTLAMRADALYKLFDEKRKELAGNPLAWTDEAQAELDELEQKAKTARAAAEEELNEFIAEGYQFRETILPKLEELKDKKRRIQLSFVYNLCKEKFNHKGSFDEFYHSATEKDFQAAEMVVSMGNARFDGKLLTKQQETLIKQQLKKKEPANNNGETGLTLLKNTESKQESSE